MKIRSVILFSALVLGSLALAGCATPGSSYGVTQGYAPPSQGYYGSADPRYAPAAGQVGFVIGSTLYQASSSSSAPNGLGAVLGAVVGGVVGNQFGHGRGRVLTTVGGAVAGGFAGNAIQDHSQRSGANLIQEVSVRFPDGTSLTVRQPYQEDFSPGERVMVSGAGSSTRVVAY